jgi:adenosylmethionine-8-amino-7-oxononanoate aminotransferase
MSKLLYKEIITPPLIATSGNGLWIKDKSGKNYLDSCGGVAVSSLGYCHPRIQEAFVRESSRISWVHAGAFTNEPAEELAELLIKQSKGLSKAIFLSSGSDAVELALKLAYQYHRERGVDTKKLIVSRQQSYHGSSLKLLNISGNKIRRKAYENIMHDTPLVSACYAYRECKAHESEQDYCDRLVSEFENTIVEHGPNNIAAFVMETVVGSTSGAVPPVEGYLKKIKAICQKYDILLILDEVMAGLGRTGKQFAYLDDNALPDMVVVGKGLAAGYQPISAVLVGESIVETLYLGSGVVESGQTHTNHPFASSIALEVQKTITEENLLDNVQKRGNQLKDLLNTALKYSDNIGDVRGRGLFVGVELVKSKDTKAPIDQPFELSKAIKLKALEFGLLTYPGAGTIDGVNGNHVLFAPPFVANEGDIIEIVDRFDRALTACLDSHGSKV